MKTLAELTEYLTHVPCRFRDVETSGKTPIFPNKKEADGTVSYEDGFPEENSRTPISGVTTNDIKRSDMNMLGQLATSELLTKKLGLKHSYDASASNYIGGYGRGIVLNHYDGHNLKEVESQKEKNDVNYEQNPESIDGYVDQVGQKIDYIPWKTRTHLYGLEEGYIHAGGVDYSRKQELTGGGTLEEDSLVVVGGYSYPVGSQADIIIPSSTIQLGPLKTTVSVNGVNIIPFGNKGKSGVVQEILIIYPPLSYIYLGNFCGTANFAISFYAKKNTTISVSMNGGASGTGVTDEMKNEVYAFPIMNTVEYTEEAEES